MSVWTIFQHALNCKTGGFITIRHNRIRDFEAQLLTEVCSDVEIETLLQPLEGEIINGLTSVNAKPDVRAILARRTKCLFRCKDYQHKL